jgi:hypothetical protein
VTGLAPGGAVVSAWRWHHLLFLVGVIFYLYRLKDILLYVSLFTVGHSVTLLGGALGGIRVDPYLIDAIIGLSIVYKGFENLGGFRRVLGFQPDTRVAVLIFGLFRCRRRTTSSALSAPSPRSPARRSR